MKVLAIVGIGGALGAVARWGLGELVPDGPGFPATTLAINVTGSFLLATALAQPAVRRRPLWQAAIGPGVLGGYTTLSTWSEQTRALLADGQAPTALAYAALTVAACLGAVALGTSLGPRA